MDKASRSLHVGGRLLQVAREHPERVALIEGVADTVNRRRWTYAQLADDALRVGRALASRFECGERIAIWAPGRPEWYLLQLGAAMAGLIIVPLNPSARRAEAEYAVRQARCAAIFSVTEFRGSQLLDIAEEIADESPDVREVVDIGQWSSFVACGDPARELPAFDEESAAMIIYTSGTTGAPKGALLAHRRILRNVEAQCSRGELDDGEIWLNPLPMYHSGGCIFVALGALVCEGTMVQMATFDSALALALVEQERITATSMVPTMALAMIEQPTFDGTDRSSLAKSFTGGTPIPPELVREVEGRFGFNFVMTFGQTESGPCVCMCRPSDPIELKSTTVGMLLDGYEAKIIDAEGIEQAFGARGELCLRSDMLMLRYWDKPEETSQTIDAEGWLHTGDLCSLDAERYVTHHGRLKDVIIRGGENISPSEVEAVLFSHPSVLDVSVVGVPDRRYGETVVAFVRWSGPAGEEAKAELMALAREELARHKVPASIWFVNDFPLTPSGKVMKFELRDWHRRFSESPQMVASEAQPTSQTP